VEGRFCVAGVKLQAACERSEILSPKSGAILLGKKKVEGGNETSKCPGGFETRKRRDRLCSNRGGTNATAVNTRSAGFQRHMNCPQGERQCIGYGSYPNGSTEVLGGENSRTRMEVTREKRE